MYTKIKSFSEYNNLSSNKNKIKINGKHHKILFEETVHI